MDPAKAKETKIKEVKQRKIMMINKNISGEVVLQDKKPSSPITNINVNAPISPSN